MTAYPEPGFAGGFISDYIMTVFYEILFNISDFIEDQFRPIYSENQNTENRLIICEYMRENLTYHLVVSDTLKNKIKTLYTTHNYCSFLCTHNLVILN